MTGGGLRTTDQGDSDLSGWEGAMWWPQLVELRTEMAPIHLLAVADCLKFTKRSCVLMAISAISKYHIVDKNTGNSVGQHPLVNTAKKAFWQLRPPIPRCMEPTILVSH